MAKDLELFIAGEWTEGTGEDHYEVHSPSTGEHLYNVPKASPADIDRAVAAAREATEEMRHWTAFERADLCLRIYDLWQGKVDEVARILSMEQGKPFEAEAKDDIAESGDYFQIAAEDVKRLKGELIPTTSRHRRMFTVRRPVGVWVAITPWNFPVMIPMEYVGPGLATGNAVIVKPPEFTSWALLEMAKVFEEAGAPKGAIQVIPGAGDIGTQLVTHDGVDAVGFTGSSSHRQEDRLGHGPQALDHGDVRQRTDRGHRRRRCGQGRGGGGLRGVLQRRAGVRRHGTGDRRRRGAR